MIRITVSVIVMGSIDITNVVKEIKAEISSDHVVVVHSLNIIHETETNAGQIEEVHGDEVASGSQGQLNVVFISNGLWLKVAPSIIFVNYLCWLFT